MGARINLQRLLCSDLGFMIPGITIDQSLHIKTIMPIFPIDSNVNLPCDPDFLY